MTTIYTLPLQPVAQQFPITLAGITYQMTVKWNSNDASGLDLDAQDIGTWMMDLYDSTGTNLIVGGIPLVTGADIMAPFAYLGLGGQLVVQSSPLADTVPDFTTLGSTGQMYYVQQP